MTRAAKPWRSDAPRIMAADADDGPCEVCGRAASVVWLDDYAPEGPRVVAVLWQRGGLQAPRGVDVTPRHRCYCSRGLSFRECLQAQAYLAGQRVDPLALRAYLAGRVSLQGVRWCGPDVLRQLRDHHPLPGVCRICGVAGLHSTAVTTRGRQLLRCWRCRLGALTVSVCLVER